jgi:hypothetical protein
MTKTVGIVLTIAFLAASLLGTLASGWILADVAAPERTGSMAAVFSSTRMYLLALAVAAEGLRLVLSLQGERIWRSSRFQGAAFAVPLWLVCTAYCALVPLLTLAAVYVTSSAVLMVLGLGWLFVQIAAGLLPGITWPAARHAADDVAMEGAFAAVPAPAYGMHAFPAGLVPQPVASAGELFQTLTHLADMPAGSKLAAHGRIDANREIVMSQGALAALVGRSKPTVRRWLQDLENQQLILRSAAGKATRIRVQPNLHTANGDARH